MIEVDDGQRGLARCPAATDLMATERDKLVALPDPLDPVRLDLTCELADGHHDCHVGFVVGARRGNQLWWLCWASGLRDVVQLQLCDGRDTDEQDDCLLPYRHRGPHSFEIQPVRQPRQDAPPLQSSA